MENRIKYDLVDGIKIYNGNTVLTQEKYEKTLQYLFSVDADRKLFTKPIPSTLTAQGQMSNISFNEQEIFDMLSEPEGQIMVIGCNYGEKYNPSYKIPAVKKKSGRGRKPKPKVKSKRRIQGSGKYFSSQITFIIKHSVSNINYKIKLFRNGVFQVPGIKDPSMKDLIDPVNVLKDYLSYNFNEDVKVLNFMAVMRNYKSKVINSIYNVNLSYIEEIINCYKSPKINAPFMDYITRSLSPKTKESLKKFVGKTNVLNIAEVNYNTDKCFCLNIKFYRPMPNDPLKKTTVKLLKKGKINFDGANSEYEVLELYYWIRYIYSTFKDKILIDVNSIKNDYNYKMLEQYKESDLIYSESDED